MESRVTLAGALLFAAGVLLLAFLLFRTIRRITYRGVRNSRNIPKSPHVWQIILALVLIVTAQGFFWLSSQLEYFRPLEIDGRIGHVMVKRLDDPVRSLSVEYLPQPGDTTGVPNKFFLSGDSWRFNGEIINFKFGRKFFNFPERAYKVVRFEGRFMDRLPQHASGALLNENLLEGGPTQAFSLFRDSRYFKWFAMVDSFSTDYVTTDKADRFVAKLEADGTVGLER